MRKSVAGLTLVGTVFAVTATAASALSVTGPFSPTASVGAARLCNPGPVSVQEVLLAEVLQSFAVTTAHSTAVADQPDCADVTIWLKVTYTPSGQAPVTMYASFPADGDYTVVPLDLPLGEEGVFYDAITGGTRVGLLDEGSLGARAVRVMIGTPSAF